MKINKFVDNNTAQMNNKWANLPICVWAGKSREGNKP